LFGALDISVLQSNLNQAKNSTQDVAQEMHAPAKTQKVISKHVRWKDQVTLAKGNPSCPSHDVVRGPRENRLRWRRLTGLVGSGQRFVLKKDTRALLLERFKVFKGEGLDCSFRSLNGRGLCKSSGLCTHTLAEIFKYMGDTIDDSLFCVGTTLGLSKPLRGTLAPKILRESRYSKQRRSNRRGKHPHTK
jgi:hypothetical protein